MNYYQNIMIIIFVKYVFRLFDYQWAIKTFRQTDSVLIIVIINIYINFKAVLKYFQFAYLLALHDFGLLVHALAVKTFILKVSF